MLDRLIRSAAATRNRRSGQKAVEYAVMLAMILMALLTAVSALGQANDGF